MREGSRLDRRFVKPLLVEQRRPVDLAVVGDRVGTEGYGSAVAFERKTSTPEHPRPLRDYVDHKDPEPDESQRNQRNEQAVKDSDPA
jgi:hypothetical protein